MFDSLRDELNKISLIESDELEMMDTGDVITDDAADDELFDDEDFDGEDMEDSIHESYADSDTIDEVIDSIILYESADMDYDDDDEDSVDYSDGVLGDGDDDLLCDCDDDDDSISADIDGTTNSIHDDVDDDCEEELDDLLEDMCGSICGDSNDIYGDSSDMPDTDVPPSPQYSKLRRQRANGREFVDYGNDNCQKYGKVFLDKELMDHMTVDGDPYDEEGNAYDLYASAGNIYDDDENEEFYGIRGKVSTDTLFGRHSINNINAAKLQDRYGKEEALDESVASFLANYMD